MGAVWDADLVALMGHIGVSTATSQHGDGHHRAESDRLLHRRGSLTRVAASSGSVGPSP